MQNTKVIGAVPPAVCSLRSNALAVFEVDCQEVDCSCCTNCAGAMRTAEITEKMNSISFRPESDPLKPRAMALDWVLHYDAMQLPASSSELTQRYILSVFYYSLAGESWQISTLKGSLWLNGAVGHCQWAGVTCDMNKNVIALSLREYMLLFLTGSTLL